MSGRFFVYKVNHRINMDGIMIDDGYSLHSTKEAAEEYTSNLLSFYNSSSIELCDVGFSEYEHVNAVGSVRVYKD